jgi:2,3-bisphosphoglycerate-independent phosphoglycerate mutase
MKRTTLLIVLDGWGLGRSDESNPVHVVNPQTFKWLEDNFPTTSLQASGISVGLPWGEVGNSEVGHLTIGAGRVVYQYFPRITLSIRDRSFFENPSLKQAFLHARENGGVVHCAGLLTEGTTHAAMDHLLALIQMGEKEKMPIMLHLFSDGKDATPFRLEKVLEKIPTNQIATLIGRYYAMDREKNWKLTKLAYDAMVGDGGIVTNDPNPIIKETYNKGSNEEFVPPIRFNEKTGIKENDSLIFFNFREDSIRQIAEAFILNDDDFKEFPRKKIANLFVTTFTKYEDRFTVPIVFPPEQIQKNLGRVFSEAGKTQLRIAESYKYAHVTYFFNSYDEAPYSGESRVFIPAVKAAHVEEYPKMMAGTITERIIQALENQAFDFILANYSNPDTMGHTGNYEAAIEAVKTIDEEMKKIVEAGLKTNTLTIITADHGNIEELTNPFSGIPETQHDPNPVPFYLVANEFKNRKFSNAETFRTQTLGALSDVAPTILELNAIPKPPEMTGSSLLSQLL